MATLRAEVTNAPQDLKTICKGADGSAVALSSGSSYSLQNVSSFRVFVSEQSAEPTVDAPKGVISPGERLEYDATAEGLWVWAGRHTEAELTVDEI